MIRSWTGVWFLGSCMALAGLVALMGWGVSFDRALLVEIRSALFTEVVTDRSVFEAPPEAITANGFRVDPPEAVAAWKRRLRREVPYLSGVEFEAGTTALEKVRELVPRFSRNGGCCCGTSRNLLHNVRRLPKGTGEGCCSDHAEVFNALAAVFGVFSREARHSSHTFSEFWDESLGKWVWVDTHYAVYAVDEDARPLSLLELRDRVVDGGRVRFEFIGNQHHRFSSSDPEVRRPFEIKYDETEDFAELAYTWGNDVFSQDRFGKRLAFLPRPVRQSVGLSTGRLPSYRILADEGSPGGHAIGRLRLVGGLLLGFVALGLVVHPARRAFRSS